MPKVQSPYRVSDMMEMPDVSKEEKGSLRNEQVFSKFPPRDFILTEENVTQQVLIFTVTGDHP